MRKTANCLPGVLRPCLIAAVLLGPHLVHADVEITGLDAALEANAKAYLRLNELDCDAPAWRVRRLLATGPAEIERGLAALGYYSARIGPTLTQAKDCWHVRFDVDAGPAVHLRAVDLAVQGEGAAESAFAAALADTPLRSGAVLNHGQYTTLKNDLQGIAVRLGYREAKFDAARIDVYPDAAAADVALRLETGPRYRFGAINFEQDILDPAFLDRYVDFAPGDPYDSHALLQLQVALQNSGYFRAVFVRPGAAQAEAKIVPIEVGLVPAARKRYTLGAGLSTNTGPRLHGKFADRRRNRKGHQGEAEISTTPVVTRGSIAYYVPRGDPRVERWGIELGAQTENTDTSRSDSLKLRLSDVLKRRGGWREQRFVDLGVESFRVASQRQTTRLLTPGVSWNKIDVEEGRRPRRGRRLDFGVSGSSTVLGSDASYLQLTAGGDWIVPVFDAGRLLLRADVGANVTADFDELPPSVRFFAGGDGSIRGYDFEELGAKDAAGNVVGGDYLLVASAEFDQLIARQWSLAAFVDAGGAVSSIGDGLSVGVGVGLRWYSALGPIRLDIAKGLDDPKRPVRFHLRLGPDL